MIPADYFYLVDIETDEPLAIFPIEHCRSALELFSIEARLRSEHNVDDPASGIALRDSAHAPLSPNMVMSVMRRMRRR